jgi:tetracycline repressor-like protein
MVRPVLGPNVIARYDYELQAVDGIGLTDVEMDAVITLIAGHVEGAARRALEAEFAERRTGQSDQDWWAEREPFLERVFEPDRFPTAARVGAAAGEAHNAAYAPEHAFWFGLQRILDGIEAFVASRSSAGEGQI